MIVFPPSSWWGWSISLTAFSLLSGENAIMPKERDGERQQHMSAAMDATLTGRAYRLCSSSLQAWLPLTAPTADKSGNIKENRRAAQLTHQCFFSSSPQPLPPIFKHHLQQLSSSSLYSSFSCTLHQGVRAVESGKWHHKNLPAVSRLIMSAAACLVSGFPQASCDPALISAHQDSSPRSGEKEGEKKINRMFFHLVNWQHHLLELCLSKWSVWRGLRLAEGRIGKWKHGELLSLDKVSELLCCSAWVSRKHPRCDRRTWRSAWLKSWEALGLSFS